MDCSPPGFSVLGISQARILEWIVISFSRRSFWSRGWASISCISRWILYHWATSSVQLLSCIWFFVTPWYAAPQASLSITSSQSPLRMYVDTVNSLGCTQASQVAPVVKNSPANAGGSRDDSLIPGSGRAPGVGNGNPLQYSCLGNPKDREAWWATVHRVAKSWHNLSDLACTVQIFCPFLNQIVWVVLVEL